MAGADVARWSTREQLLSSAGTTVDHRCCDFLPAECTSEGGEGARWEDQMDDMGLCKESAHALYHELIAVCAHVNVSLARHSLPPASVAVRAHSRAVGHFLCSSGQGGASKWNIVRKDGKPPAYDTGVSVRLCVYARVHARAFSPSLSLSRTHTHTLAPSLSHSLSHTLWCGVWER